MTEQAVFRAEGDWRFRLPATSEHGECLVFATRNLLSEDRALDQLIDASRLPGLVGPAMAIPDIHEGYGFPIGAVVAVERSNGAISPAGVGYDINCGVRVYCTELSAADFLTRRSEALRSLYQAIPSGLGAGSRFPLKRKDLLDILALGARWCIRQDFGQPEELEATEDGGYSAAADGDLLSEKAMERGMAQLGSLGSGNHFLEIQQCEEIFQPETAAQLGIVRGMITVMIHSGSRGLGHQVCSDFVQEMARKSSGGRNKEISCASVPLRSELGQRYYRAMMAAANYAWANRQKIAHHSLQTLKAVFGSSLQPRLLYDMGHNLARLEEIVWQGQRRELLIHRKGAGRALPPGDILLAEPYRHCGQPVIIPGDMGRSSWLLTAQEGNEEISFSSVAHGAGRRLSRQAAVQKFRQEDVLASLQGQNVEVQAANRRSLLEEAPLAYKDVRDIIAVMQGTGIARPLARLRPLAVIKG